MPATEDTWRNQKLMHLVFGVTALVMLLGTVWMFADDHRREWKEYQRKFRKIETWTTQARMAEERTTQHSQREKELQAKLNADRQAVPDKALVDRLTALIKTHRENYDNSALESAYQSLSDDPSRSARDRLLKVMRGELQEAKRQENNLSRAMKFRRADLDVDKSAFDRAVGESQPQAVVDALQAKVDATQADVNRLSLEVQDARTYRLEVEAILAEATAQEMATLKEIEDLNAGLARLDVAMEESRLSPLEQLLTMPILDAFGRPLSIDQIWLPNLTINNNFRDVARFDRCTTCHRAMDKTAPGSGVIPGYAHEEVEVIELPTPDTDPRLEQGSEESGEETVELTQVSYLQEGDELPESTERDREPEELVKEEEETAEADAVKPDAPPAQDSKNYWIEKIYGIRLADQGIEPTDVALAIVWPESPAAKAGLEMGDVIVAVGDASANLLDRQLNHQEVVRYLIDEVSWGQPVKLTVRRGVPHPFSSHPRLDLFVGPLSPHPMGQVGCTICHDGQGSATSFMWASHTPNDPKQREEWGSKYGWYENHHWIFPMNPERFAESSCLKCHHQVTELEASEQFLDPPAPNLVEGFKLVQDFGCFGCHEISGYNGPDKRVGPDLRTEPPIYAAAEQVLADANLTPSLREMAQHVVAHPEDNAARRLLAELIADDAARGKAYESDEKPVLSAVTHKMGEMLGADYETPGTYRKVGPSLRHLASKADFAFVYQWIKEPKSFRPTTKMPQFFGLWDHLTLAVEEEGAIEAGGLDDAERFEPVEIHATTHYLLSSSQPFEYLAPPEGVTEPASAERGKQAFQLRGCLACHQHSDFPEAQATQGPDLSRLGSKLGSETGRKWLYSWIRQPNRYHARTVMPDLFLESVTDAEGKVTDPAADVVEYLVSSQGWEVPPVPELNEKDLDELALEYLSATFTARQSKEYLSEGIPESMAGELKGDEVVLVGPMSLEKKLSYVGRRSISKLGCTGCHDVPGFEDAKPIGTALADWGRKDPSKLAFEQIARYLSDSHGRGAAAAGGEGHGDAKHSEAGHGHQIEVQNLPPDEGYFVQALLGGHREGFIWQKLHAPRSYDYLKTENKTYNERLRMPKFPFSEKQIESVITFVLGLVSEPPKDQYVYQADPRQQAIVDGRQVLDKYNCGGCHVLSMETWEFDYDPTLFGDPPPVEDYDFTIPHFSPKQLAESRQVDRRGYGRARVVGWPVRDAEGNPLETEDDDGNPAWLFNLWRSLPINGQPWLVGVTDLLLSDTQVVKRYPGVGGDLAKLIYPAVLAAEKEINPNVKDGDAWGWVPPPLLNEGRKVQTDWLHSFLLDPYPIRPAVVLRMPRFNMSSEEAAKLVDYFAAMDSVEYPYAYDPRTASEHLAAEEARHPHRLDDALKLVTNRNYCVQCHQVGDFVPEGSIKAQAPQLDRVYRRLRPEFLRAWIANPKRLLPYTGMPVNFPVNKPASAELYHGTSVEQVDAVTDLLLNWDLYSKRQISIKDKVPPPSTGGAEGGAATEPAADAAGAEETEPAESSTSEESS